MGAIKDLVYNGHAYSNAYLRMSSFPNADKDNGMVRISLDLYPSKQAYKVVKELNNGQARQKALCQGYIIATIFSRPNHQTINDRRDLTPECGLMVTTSCPDVVRFWGENPGEGALFSDEDWPKNAPAQAWELVMLLSQLNGWKADE